jgi:hypothetical protein
MQSSVTFGGRQSGTMLKLQEQSMNKTELLDNLHAEHQQWAALLAQIGEARMDQPGAAGPWSMKDIVAHLTGWSAERRLKTPARSTCSAA